MQGQSNFFFHSYNTHLISKYFHVFHFNEKLLLMQYYMPEQLMNNIHLPAADIMLKRLLLCSDKISDHILNRT